MFKINLILNRFSKDKPFSKVYPKKVRLYKKHIGLTKCIKRYLPGWFYLEKKHGWLIGFSLRHGSPGPIPMEFHKIQCL